MDEDCRDTLLRHTRCDEVMRCLELAGYKTREVLACIDTDLDTEVRLIEESVRRACIHMDEEARRPYIGLYARSPAEFKFPIGVKRALLLAVRELAQSSRGKCNASTQTTAPFVDINAASAWAHPQTHGSQIVAMPAGAATTPVSLPQLPIFTTEHGALSTPPPGTPTTASRVHFHPLYGMSPPTTTSMSAAFHENNSGLQMSPHHHHHHHHLTLSNSSSLMNGMDCDVNIDLEKLKSNSTASVIRLSSKQYHDAELVEGRDFEVKIELTTGEDGYKRATGIYCCNLCLGKRGEVSAVRFSIAKNRYPVVSNVMSHLKIHFVARLPPLPRTMIGHAAAAAAVAMTAASNGMVPQNVWPHVKQEVNSWPTPPVGIVKNEPWLSTAVWPSPQAVGAVAPDLSTDIASPTESTTEAASMDSNER